MLDARCYAYIHFVWMYFEGCQCHCKQSLAENEWDTPKTRFSYSNCYSGNIIIIIINTSTLEKKCLWASKSGCKIGWGIYLFCFGFLFCASTIQISTFALAFCATTDFCRIIWFTREKERSRQQTRLLAVCLFVVVFRVITISKIK